ncbi:hypothetical protein L1987_35914 [Smallanthus sonchifolius]|uniref:Uncharacterized protein n=1 Tax=Smallanthus sonchifolius TaxID=185202 RepID=A0ACB9HBP6_9ASTR|nr:hypothetical protein L1987_35914 [Smallanthus sonchifolius]
MFWLICNRSASQRCIWNKTVSFVSLDGEFELMRYCITIRVNLPFWISGYCPLSKNWATDPPDHLHHPQEETHHRLQYNIVMTL